MAAQDHRPAASANGPHATLIYITATATVMVIANASTAAVLPVLAKRIGIAAAGALAAIAISPGLALMPITAGQQMTGRQLKGHAALPLQEVAVEAVTVVAVVEAAVADYLLHAPSHGLAPTGAFAKQMDSGGGHAVMPIVAALWPASLWKLRPACTKATAEMAL